MSATSRPARTAVDNFLEGLPRGKLIEMLRAYAGLYQKLDGFWYVSVKDKWGNDHALDRDLWVWERVIGYEVRLVTAAMGLQGAKDIGSFLRVFGASPVSLISEYRAERRSDREVLLTTTNCPILAVLEKEGQGREKDICQRVDVAIFAAYARYFGAGLSFVPLKLPPRANRNETPCQWALTSKEPDCSTLPPSGQPFDGLSPGTLRELVKVYCRLYQVMDAHWYMSIRERWGNDAAMERDYWVWDRVTKSEVDAIVPLWGLGGRKDIEAFVRLFLTLPMNITLDYTIDRLDASEAVVTVSHCPVLRALEKEGQGREKDICQDFDVAIFRNYSRFFNPTIAVTALKLPPRKSDTDIACRWQFRPEPESSPSTR